MFFLFYVSPYVLQESFSHCQGDRIAHFSFNHCIFIVLILRITLDKLKIILLCNFLFLWVSNVKLRYLLNWFSLVQKTFAVSLIKLKNYLVSKSILCWKNSLVYICLVHIIVASFPSYVSSYKNFCQIVRASTTKVVVTRSALFTSFMRYTFIQCAFGLKVLSSTTFLLVYFVCLKRALVKQEKMLLFHFKSSFRSWDNKC